MAAVITTDLDTPIGQVRFKLGDDIEGKGVLPEGANLHDDQITALLVEESGVVMRAVAAAAALVARRWAMACSTAAGPLKSEFQQIYAQWQQQATLLAAAHGQAGASASGVTTVRVERFSDTCAEYRRGPC